MAETEAAHRAADLVRQEVREATEAQLAEVVSPLTSTRFEQTQFRAFLRGLSFTRSGDLIITLLCDAPDAKAGWDLHDTWEMGLIVGVWRQ